MTEEEKIVIANRCARVNANLAMILRPAMRDIRSSLRETLGITREIEKHMLLCLRKTLELCETDVDDAEALLPQFKPQLTITTHDEAQMDDEIVVQKTTTFHETSGVEHHEIVQHIPRDILNPAPSIDLLNFLERPKIVRNFTWAATDALYSTLDPLGELKFPNVILDSADGDIVLSKLNGVYLFRPDIEVTVRINTTPMHYGRLMFAVYPMPDILPSEYQHAQNASGAEWYQISANKNQSVTFVVPYRNIADWIDLTQTVTSVNRALFRLKPYVTAPLHMTTGTATPVTVAIYARMVKPRLCGWTTCAAKAEMDTESSQKTSKGLTISSGLSAVGDFITCFEDVPILGAYAKPIGYSIGRSAKLLKKYGYSVPANCSTVQPVRYRSVLYTCNDDCPTTVKLGCAQDIQVSKDFDLVYDEPDCLTVLKICQRPFLIYTGRITSANTENYTMFSRLLSPTNMYYEDFNGDQHTASDYHIWAGAYLSNLSSMWRGGFRVAVSFIASSFHSCRVRATWDPCQTNTTAPGLKVSQNVFNIVMDINEQTDFTFTIPYMADTHWLTVTPPSATPVYGTNIGTLFMTLLTPLTSASPTVNPIYFQVFISAAADFQLALPTSSDISTIGVAQMDSIPAGTLPTCSYIGLSQTDYPVIGGLNIGVTSSNRNTSAVIDSVKQLYSALTPFWTNPNASNEWMGCAANNPKATIKFQPYGKYEYGNISTDKQKMFRANHFLYTRLLFMFHRGSTRVSVLSEQMNNSARLTIKDAVVLNPAVGKTYVRVPNNTMMIQSSLHYTPGDSSIGQLLDVPISTGMTNDEIFQNADPNTVNYSTGFATHSTPITDTHDVTIPYYSVYNCQHLCYGNTASYNDTPTLQITLPHSTQQLAYEVIASGNTSGGPGVTTYGTPVNYTWPIRYAAFLAGGDDYIMGCQLPVPTMQRLTPPARRRRSVDNVLDELDGELDNHVVVRRSIDTQFEPPGYRSRRHGRGMSIESEEHAIYRKIVNGDLPMPQEWIDKINKDKEDLLKQQAAYYAEQMKTTS